MNRLGGVLQPGSMCGFEAVFVVLYFVVFNIFVNESNTISVHVAILSSVFFSCKQIQFSAVSGSRIFSVTSDNRITMKKVPYREPQWAAEERCYYFG